MEPAIKTKKLSKVFGNRRAVDNVSIEVPQGAFLSIFGPNGAGKTTLLRVDVYKRQPLRHLRPRALRPRKPLPRKRERSGRSSWASSWLS